DGEAALPAGVGRIGRGEALGDGEAFTERGQRLVEATLRLRDVADPVMSDGEVALPVGVGRVGRGEALEDGERVAERGQRLVQAALGLQDITEKALRAANPRRIGCGACEIGDIAGFGLELSGFSAPMAYPQRSEQRLHLGRCGEPTTGS